MSNMIQNAKEFSTKLLTQELDNNFLYHNLRHTQRVVQHVTELAEHYKLDENQKEVMIIAAWFHDTGYSKGVAEHEEKGCILCADFLKNNNYPTAKIELVSKLIMATKRYHKPVDLNEEIIRDADASHLGQKSYAETSELLRQELARLGIVEFTPAEWRAENIKMFRKEHHFYTDYAKEKWQNRKEKNLQKIIKAQKEEKKLFKKESIKAKLKSDSPDRGIQTMFRVQLGNHLRLSDIADTKANILLSVNAIVISLSLSNLIPKLDNPSNTHLIWPTLIFIIFSVASMSLAVLATRPNVTRGTFSKEDVKNKKVNILFFGNFHRMKLDDYEWAIEEMLQDKNYIYSSLAKDLYFLGLVLNRKYAILRWTYTIFMTGMVISVIAFAIAFKYYGI